jgi:DNA-directed RNA polymerase subunit RPC12/RpoP
MAPKGPLPPEPPVARRADCPRCGGRLSEPISGDLHCYVECSRCGEKFELDEPELAASPERSR